MKSIIPTALGEASVGGKPVWVFLVNGIFFFYNFFFLCNLSSLQCSVIRDKNV